MLNPLKKLAGTAAALALCASLALAETNPVAAQPVTPLVAVSVFGTQASAQAVSSQAGSAAATAGAAVAAQSDFDDDRGITTAGWVMIVLDLVIAGWGISTLFDDDDDDGEAISPA